MQVTAKSNIKHDGQDFAKGDSFEVNEKQAADLLAAGAIEPAEGVQPTPPEEAPDKSKGTAVDVKDEEKNGEAVRNLPIKMNMKKTVLIGIARANGLPVEKTATPAEVYNTIKDYREKNNIVVDEEPKKPAPGQATEEEAKAAEEAKAKEDAEAKEKEEAEAKEKEEEAAKKAEADKTPKTK